MFRPTSLHVYLLVILVSYHSVNAATCRLRATCKYVDEQIEELKNNLGYVGCFIDDKNRLFDTRKPNSANMSLKRCREQCRGYIYVGLQNGRECFCGNTLNVNKYPPKPESQCQHKCSGERNRKCGGHWKMSIYTGIHLFIKLICIVLCSSVCVNNGKNSNGISCLGRLLTHTFQIRR
ncbi:unnamed protein product [Mytilus coruscus]|uniref:WSC domain-containing protein n=1 Tax=Mytilus coruscus TaxID=42192 RepID=A0A6J8CZ98_MYTCO|nr:unnamed protein product [Mytilus coruscus]